MCVSQNLGSLPPLSRNVTLPLNVWRNFSMAPNLPGSIPGNSTLKSKGISSARSLGSIVTSLITDQEFDPHFCHGIFFLQWRNILLHILTMFLYFSVICPFLCRVVFRGGLCTLLITDMGRSSNCVLVLIYGLWKT